MSFQSKIDEINQKLKEAKENIEATDLGELILEKANLYKENSYKKEALDTFKEVLEQSISTNSKMEAVFGILLISMNDKNMAQLGEYIEKCKEMLEKGGDWEKRNKLKVYEGLFLVLKKDFAAAGKLFLEALLTFTSKELFEFRQFVFYTVITNIVSLDRVELKRKVVDNSDIASCINETEHLQEFLECFYYGKYKEFMHRFVGIIDVCKNDFFLSGHIHYFIREMRVKLYSQFLKSYKSITLENMAASLGVSVEFVDKELSAFISSGRLSAKIDKVNGIIECVETEETAELYQRTLKESDVLLNKVHKLSKLLEV